MIGLTVGDVVQKILKFEPFLNFEILVKSAQNQGILNLITTNNSNEHQKFSSLTDSSDMYSFPEPPDDLDEIDLINEADEKNNIIHKDTVIDKNKMENKSEIKNMNMNMNINLNNEGYKIIIL